MPVVFDHAPLIEIVAEIKWVPGDFFTSASSPGGSIGLLDLVKCEEFFRRALIALNGIGFTSSERLIPQGFPVGVQQPVYRHRTDGGAKVLQVGIGLISANALPPYQSWSQFEQSLGPGLSTTIEVAKSFGDMQFFNSVTLRYIDAFRPEHTGGLESAKFMRDVLKIHPGLPPAITKYVNPMEPVHATMQARVSTLDGLLLTVGVGEGLASGIPALLFETGLASQKPVQADGVTVLALLRQQHDILHEMFFELIRPIFEQLGPRDIP